MSDVEILKDFIEMQISNDRILYKQCKKLKRRTFIIALIFALYAYYNEKDKKEIVDIYVKKEDPDEIVKQ